MTERQMENLIAAFPADFFPRRKFVLKGRQQSFAGVGRYDLLFEDEFQAQILMELKARTAKYDDAEQLARYKKELKRCGQSRIVMWLVAPRIPDHVREFLDDIGIEYSEIHIPEFIQVANRHGVALEDDHEDAASPSAAKPPRVAVSAPRSPRRQTARVQVETGPVVTGPGSLRWSARGYDLALVNHDALDGKRLTALIDAFEEAVPSRRNASIVEALRRWAGDTRQPLPYRKCQSLLRWVITSSWSTAVPHAEALWTYLFGSPAPTWQTWNGKKYEFDTAGWKRWYASLSH